MINNKDRNLGYIYNRYKTLYYNSTDKIIHNYNLIIISIGNSIIDIGNSIIKQQYKQQQYKQ